MTDRMDKTAAGASAPASYSPGDLAKLVKKAGINSTRHRRAILVVLETMLIVGEDLPPVAILERAQEIEPTVTLGAVQRFLQRLRDNGLIVRRSTVLGQIVGAVMEPFYQKRIADMIAEARGH